MTMQRFRVYHAGGGDHVAVIECDDSLLAPDAGILDHKTMTLRPIKNGGMFTLIPIEDHTVTTLRRVKEVYENTKKGAEFFSTHLSRVDELLSAVGLLFGTVEYTVVENKEDMDKIINPPRDEDYEPKKVKYSVLGDMLTAAVAAAGDDDGEEKKCGETEEGHVHGPNCSHK